LTSDIRVAGNFVDSGRAGIVANTVTTLIIESNIVVVASDGKRTGIALGSVKDGQVKNNRVTAGGIATLCSAGGPNQVTGNSLSDGDIGVALRREISPVIAQNHIDAMRSAGIQCGGITGRCEIVQNRITSCGFRSASGTGIQVTQNQGELHVEGNEVMDTGLSPDRQIVAPLAVGISGTLVLEASIANNYVGYTDPASRPTTNEDRALLVTCLEEKRDAFGPAGYPIGPGKSALVEVQEQGTGDQRLRFERVFFSNNYCFHNPPPQGTDTPRTAATVNLFGRVATVMGNQIKATRSAAGAAVFPSVNFNGMPGPFVGNVISGGVSQHADFPAPQANFNLTA
jgi:Right handed beta helix region